MPDSGPVPGPTASHPGHPRGTSDGLSAPSVELRSSAWWWVRAAAIAISIYASYELVLVLGGILGAVAHPTGSSSPEVIDRLSS